MCTWRPQRQTSLTVDLRKLAKLKPLSTLRPPAAASAATLALPSQCAGTPRPTRSPRVRGTRKQTGSRPVGPARERGGGMGERERERASLGTIHNGGGQIQITRNDSPYGGSRASPAGRLRHHAYLEASAKQTHLFLFLCQGPLAEPRQLAVCEIFFDASVKRDLISVSFDLIKSQKRQNSVERDLRATFRVKCRRLTRPAPPSTPCI